MPDHPVVYVEIPMGSRNKYSGELRAEIEHFFNKELEEKKTETRGFGNRAEAEQIIADARARAG